VRRIEPGADPTRARGPEPAPERRVLVTLPLDEDGRRIITGAVGDVARVVVLADVPAVRRRLELERADALLADEVGTELADEDWLVLADRDDVAAPARRDPGARPPLLQLLWAGVDRAPFGRIPPGISIAGNAGGWAEPIAEHVLAMILALAKRLPSEQEALRRGVFNQDLPTRLLRGGTCAILGFGGIGRAVAPLARALGMRVVAVNSSGATPEPVDLIGTLDDLERFLRAADVVVLSLPLTRSTRGLIGGRELGWMKPGAILVNVARGPVIDEAALYAHLRRNPGFSAGLDVWWDEPFRDGRLRLHHPFFTLANVLGSPHNSGTVHGWDEVALRRAAENVRRYLRGEPVVGLVRREEYE